MNEPTARRDVLKTAGAGSASLGLLGSGELLAQQDTPETPAAEQNPVRVKLTLNGKPLGLELDGANVTTVEGRLGSDLQIRGWMSGNLCRCGAYPDIAEAIRRAARRQGETVGDDAAQAAGPTARASSTAARRCST